MLRQISDVILHFFYNSICFLVRFLGCPLDRLCRSCVTACISRIRIEDALGSIPIIGVKGKCKVVFVTYDEGVTGSSCPRLKSNAILFDFESFMCYLLMFAVWQIMCIELYHFRRKNATLTKKFGRHKIEITDLTCDCYRIGEKLTQV